MHPWPDGEKVFFSALMSFPKTDARARAHAATAYTYAHIRARARAKSTHFKPQLFRVRYPAPATSQLLHTNDSAMVFLISSRFAGSSVVGLGLAITAAELHVAGTSYCQ